MKNPPSDTVWTRTAFCSFATATWMLPFDIAARRLHVGPRGMSAGVALRGIARNSFLKAYGLQVLRHSARSAIGRPIVALNLPRDGKGSWCYTLKLAGTVSLMDFTLLRHIEERRIQAITHDLVQNAGVRPSLGHVAYAARVSSGNIVYYSSLQCFRHKEPENATFLSRTEKALQMSASQVIAANPLDVLVTHVFSGQAVNFRGIANKAWRGFGIQMPGVLVANYIGLYLLELWETDVRNSRV